MKKRYKLFKDLRPLELFAYNEWLFFAVFPNPCIEENYLGIRISDGSLWIFDRRDKVCSHGHKLGYKKFNKHEKSVGELYKSVLPVIPKDFLEDSDEDL